MPEKEDVHGQVLKLAPVSRIGLNQAMAVVQFSSPSMSESSMQRNESKTALL